MELALIIAIVALIVALPGCIADSLTLIDKLRAKKGHPSRPTLNPLKKIIKSGHDQTNLLGTEPNKKIGSSCTACNFSSVGLTHPDIDHFAAKPFFNKA